MPGNLAAGLHYEAAHAKEAAGHIDLLLGKVDLAQKLLIDALVRGGAGPLTVCWIPHRVGHAALEAVARITSRPARVPATHSESQKPLRLLRVWGMEFPRCDIGARASRLPQHHRAGRDASEISIGLGYR